MKIRHGYVSNSSSSSYLVPHQVTGRVTSIRLPENIWKAIEKNHVDWEGNRIDMSCSQEWWLTTMISDCMTEYCDISSIPGAIQYLDGNDMPYGMYDTDGEKDYIVFKKNGEEYYVLVTDFMDCRGVNDIPDCVELREQAKKILESTLNKTQKINAIKKLFDF